LVILFFYFFPGASWFFPGVPVRLAGGWWLVLICSERKVLVAGGWFVPREKYCWLVADKPSEQGGG
jgi:hypothetical protein